MSTYAEVKARIAREMHRTDLSADIVTHMGKAIDHYASRRTWENEALLTVVTVADVSTVTVTGLQREDRVAVVVGDTDYALTKTTSEAMEDDHGADDNTGQPVEYCRTDTGLRLWPTPDAVYSVKVNGIFDDTALSNDADTNSWTTIAEDLIVSRTKKTLSRDVTYDNEMEAAADRAEREARNELFAKTNERTAAGRFSPGW